nr:hypothetical protein [Tanacetum cinerariifolium]
VDKVLSMQDDEVEPAELQEVVEVVTTSKLITKVVTAASATITTAAPQLITAIAPQLTIAAAPTLTTAPSVAKRRKGVVIRDPEETSTPTPSTIIHSKSKSKDKGKRIFKFNSNVAFLHKTKEQMEEENIRALKRISETQEEKAAKKQKLVEEISELKRHIQIMPNDDDNVYTEATPVARKLDLCLDFGGRTQTLLCLESFLLLLPYESEQFQGYFTLFLYFMAYIVEHLIQSEP